MAKQKIPYIQPIMLKQQPDQVCSIINRLIEEFNSLQQG